MKTININGKDYKIKYSIRAIFIWENIMDRPFEIKTLMDNYILFYCMVLANNPENIISWEEFTNALDENPLIIKEIGDIISQQDVFKRLQENFDPKKSAKKGVQKKS